MPIIRSQDWRPRGIDDLEPDAWRALRQAGSTCVIAGPGAGKTEFLAQRAVYLLETGLCPAPYRVLAISFKSDAAENLATRVRKRCPAELANRFTSLTFDAFAKGLVDRFLSAIPAHWCPTRPYDLVFPTRRQKEGFLNLSSNTAPRNGGLRSRAFTLKVLKLAMSVPTVSLSRNKRRNRVRSSSSSAGWQDS